VTDAPTSDTAEAEALTIIPESRVHERLAREVARHVPQLDTVGDYLRATLSALVRGQDLEFTGSIRVMVRLRRPGSGTEVTAAECEIPLQQE